MTEQQWQLGWRKIASRFETETLRLLVERLRTNDARIIHGGTVSPPPLYATASHAPDAACPIGCLCWWEQQLTTTSEVEDAFQEATSRCFGMDSFMHWWDHGDSDRCRRELAEFTEALIVAREVEAMAQQESA